MSVAGYMSDTVIDDDGNQGVVIYLSGPLAVRIVIHVLLRVQLALAADRTERVCVHRTRVLSSDPKTTVPVFFRSKISLSQISTTHEKLESHETESGGVGDHFPLKREGKFSNKTTSTETSANEIDECRIGNGEDEKRM